MKVWPSFYQSLTTGVYAHRQPCVNYLNLVPNRSLPPA